MTPSEETTTPGRTPASKSPSEIAEGVFVGGWKDALTFDGDRCCVLAETPDDMPPGRHIPVYDEEKGRANLGLYGARKPRQPPRSAKDA